MNDNDYVSDTSCRLALLEKYNRPYVPWRQHIATSTASLFRRLRGLASRFMRAKRGADGA